MNENEHKQQSLPESKGGFGTPVKPEEDTSTPEGFGPSVSSVPSCWTPTKPKYKEKNWKAKPWRS